MAESIFSNRLHTEEDRNTTDETTPDQLPPQGEVEQARQALADEIQEPVSVLTKRIDITKSLDKFMSSVKNGLIVDITMTSPKTTKTINASKKNEDGMKGREKIGLALSQEVGAVFDEYFSLGSHILMTRALKLKMSNIQSNARRNLKEHSINSPWGRFVPAKKYQEWKAKNESYQQAFEEAKQEVLAQHEGMVNEIMAGYRQLAEEFYQHRVFGKVVLRDGATNLSRLQEILDGFRGSGGGENMRAITIEAYLNEIRQAIPTYEEIEEQYTYTTTIGFVPLSRTLARDQTEIDALLLDRTRLEAEQETIRNGEWLKQQEQFAIHEKAMGELARQTADEALQAEMERDVIRQNSERSRDILTDFYNGFVNDINTYISRFCTNALASIQEHGGILRGPISQELTNKIKELEALNFSDDETIKAMIEQLKSIETNEEAKERAGRGTERIKTDNWQTVLQQVKRESDQMMIALNNLPQPRGAARRSATIISTDEIPTIDVNARRVQLHRSEISEEPETSYHGRSARS